MGSHHVALALTLALALGRGEAAPEPGAVCEPGMEHGASSGGAPQPPRGTPLVFLAGAVLVAVGVVAARPERRDLAVAAAIGVVATALRLVFGAFGPFHVNGQGPLWLDMAVLGRARLDPAYGPGYGELLGPVARAFPGAPDDAVFVTVALASAAVTVAAWVLARSAGTPRISALAAAGVLCIDPVALRVAATESYHPLLSALALGATAAFAGSSACFAAGRRRAAALLALGACLLAAQAVRVHPAGWIPAALAPLGALAAPRHAPPRHRLLGAGILGLLALVTVGMLDGGVVRDALVAIRSGSLYRPGHLPLREVAWLPTVALLVAAATRLTARPWLLAVAASHTLAASLTYKSFEQSWIWQQSYLRLFAPAVVVALAANLPRCALIAAAAAVAVVVAVRGPRVVRARTTEHAEYRWVRSALRAAPPGCRVAYMMMAGRRVAALPVYPPLREIALDDRGNRALPAEGCVYWIRGSLCSSADGRPACDAVEAQLALEPVAAARFPPIPSYDELPYDSPEVECVLSRVVGRSPGRAP